MRVANLAHGAFFMLGAYVGLSALRAGLGFFAAVLLGGLAIALLGGLVERFLLRRLAGKTLAQVLITLGIAFIIGDASLLVWSGDPMPLPLPQALSGAVPLLGVFFPKYRLVVVAISVAVAAILWFALERTRIGAMIRAGVDDMEMARGLGIAVPRLFTIVFCAGAALAGMGGVLGGPILSVYPGLDMDMLPLALIVLILGGAGNLLRRLRRQLLHRVPLHVRSGAPSRPRLRHPLLAHGRRARPPARGPLPPARRMKRLAVPAAAALLVAVAFLPNDYYVNIASQILIAAIFASSLNLLVGYGGLISLGHAGYLGASAYIVAWLVTRAGFSHLWASLGALGLTTLMAGVFGVLSLRATGLGFVMITLALGQILWGVAYRWVSLTGGDNGLSGFGRPQPFGLDLSSASRFYLFALAVFALAFLFSSVFVRSTFGAGLQGARDQPRRMQALGWDVWSIRFVTFVVAGFWAAVAGILYADYNQFISPHVLALTNSAEVLLMVIAGGAATLLGPVVGAAVVVLLKNVVSAYVTRWVLLLGLVFVLIVLYMPEGLVPGIERLRRRFARRGAEA
jgi:branched-chain amino acid transport system permease protein